MTQAPPYTSPGAPLQPHRGVMILVFGILGIVVCFIFGIVAWVMGNTDLKAMAAGTMDRSGEGLTTAGKICGIISVVLGIMYTCGGIVWVAIAIGLAGAAAASGAAGGGG